MRISQPGPEDVEQLARLQHLDTLGSEPAGDALAAFASELSDWWARRVNSHFAFVARHATQEVVGVAWVALSRSRREVRTSGSPP